MEGMEILEQINSQFCDEDGRPYRDIRILHTHVLDDPFDDPPQVRVDPKLRYASRCAWGRGACRLPVPFVSEHPVAHSRSVRPLLALLSRVLLLSGCTAGRSG